MDAKIFAVFLIKVVCDASSRITLFGAFMYTFNSGQFSTQIILIYYYGMVGINMLVNSIFSLLDRKEDRLDRGSIRSSPRNGIGPISKKTMGFWKVS